MPNHFFVAGTIAVAALAVALPAHAEQAPPAKPKAAAPARQAVTARAAVAPALNAALPDQTWGGIGFGIYRGDHTSGGAGRLDFTHTTGKLLLRGEFSGYLDNSYTRCFLFCGSISEHALMIGYALSPALWVSTGINRTATNGFGDPVPGFVTAGVPLELMFAPRTPHPVGVEVALHADLNHKTSLVALTVGVRFGSMPRLGGNR